MKRKQGGIKINKTITAGLADAEQATGDLELINRYTRKNFTADELYMFSVILCDNEIDRDTERFSVEALEKLAKLFVGKTGIFDHSMSGKDQTSRIYSAEVITDETRETAAGEKYTFVKAKAYTVRTQKNADLIAEIDAGIKKEVSVGCAVSKAICSVCGKDMRTELCEHVKGEIYAGKLCHRVLCEPTDAYEWSFVAVPAQKGAGVVKAFAADGAQELGDILKAVKTADELTLTKAKLGELRSYINSIEEKAALGEEYRTELLLEVIKSGALALPDMKGENLSDICSALTVKQLRQLRDAMRAQAAKSAPFIRQLGGKESGETPAYDEFKI